MGQCEVVSRQQPIHAHFLQQLEGRGRRGEEEADLKRGCNDPDV
jgi:hypothetical protein